MLPIGTWLYTLIFGKLAGKDEFGNRYYHSSRGEGEHVGRPGKERRWVIYKGQAEPSRVPPLWHAWLHYASDEIPGRREPEEKYPWQKGHLPNLTGTELAYLPPGHPAKGGKRAKATGDYAPWLP